jgi:AcrR family transcriptional regulator
MVAKRSKPRRKYHHGDLRRGLIDAALDVVDRDGIEALNLRDLARRLGVSPAAPYRHFADKEALVVAIVDEIVERFTVTVGRSLAEATPDPLGQYRAAGIAQVCFAAEHPAHFRVMCHSEIADRVWSGALGRGRDEIRTALHGAQARGEIASLPLDDMMLAAESLTYGLARLIADRHPAVADIDRDKARELAVAITEVIGVGLLPRASG